MKKRMLAAILTAVLAFALTIPATAVGDVAKAGERMVVSTSQTHRAAIDENGGLWVWGSNRYGAVGNGGGGNSKNAYFSESDGAFAIQTLPTKVMDDVASVVCGNGNGLDHSGFTLAIKNDGSLWAWGRNNMGQLGNGTTVDAFSPVKVMDDVVAVSAGRCCSAALKSDGSLWVWGGYATGGKTNASDGYYTHPEGRTGGQKIQNKPVELMKDVAAVRLKDEKGLARKTDGTVWSWERKEAPQQSNNSEDAEVFTAETADGTYVFKDFYSGNLAVKADGTLWSKGSGEYGQIGNGTQKRDMKEGSQKSYVQIFLGSGTMPRTVKLILNGGKGVSGLWVEAGGFLKAPTNPTKEGYTFGGWYTDAALTIPWNFNSKVVNTLTLYAKWVPVSSTASKTGKNQSTISLNGKNVTLDAYTLKAANGGDVTYVKLRDVAALLENTSVKFNVDWKRGAIYVASKSAYTTKNGTELKAISGTDGSYKWNQAPVLFDGTTKALEGIVLTDGKGGGHTFFKLRDLGEALGFTVGWSAERGIFIETK